MIPFYLQSMNFIQVCNQFPSKRSNNISKFDVTGGSLVNVLAGSGTVKDVVNFGVEVLFAWLRNIPFHRDNHLGCQAFLDPHTYFHTPMWTEGTHILKGKRFSRQGSIERLKGLC
ncbi:hypothetical protein E2542_SST11986 [Spatholobus suberectus]|nr:hypothetical protein E2542_SST11986 [Spatholobus suberectus]